LKGAKAVETKLDVKIGTLRVEVKKGELESDFKVSTPQLTASVRGTQWELRSSRSFGDTITGFEGRVACRNLQGGNRSVHSGESTTSDLHPTIDTEKLARAYLALRNAGLTEEELRAAFNLPAGGTTGAPGDVNAASTFTVARQTAAPEAVMQQRNIVGQARDIRGDFLASGQV
jgi:hypothetical protein